MKYFQIEPDVAGGLGSQTVIDTSKIPPLVSRLHYTFEAWFGDEILETFPCFIVTKALADDIMKERLSGVVFDNVIIDGSENFEALYPATVLPPFVWMKVEGRQREDDFFISLDRRLAVSEHAWRIIEPRAPNCRVIEVQE